MYINARSRPMLKLGLSTRLNSVNPAIKTIDIHPLTLLIKQRGNEQDNKDPHGTYSCPNNTCKHSNVYFRNDLKSTTSLPGLKVASVE